MYWLSDYNTYGVWAGSGGGGMMATIDTTSRRTWQDVVREDCKEFKMDRKGKKHQKKRQKILSFHICVVTTYPHLAAFVFVPSVFGEKFSTVEF
jgi:hypothetical protein